MRFLDFNLADPLNGSTITASSEQDSFPASNLAKQSPSRVWRSNGTFVIELGVNDSIDFRETFGGPEISVFLTPGSYSVSGLETEIKAKMDAGTLNARSYTIDYGETTGFWTVTGSTFLELLFGTGTNLSSSVASSIGFAAADFTGATFYLGSQPAIHTEETVLFDTETIGTKVDSFAILFSQLNGILLSDSATINLQGNATNNFNSPSVDVVVSVDNDFFIATHFFSSDQSLRYWRVKIVDPQNQNLFVELGGVVLAKGTTLTDMPQAGFRWSLTDLSKITRNNFGNEYVDIFPFKRSIGFDYRVLRYDDVKTLEEIFKRNGVRTPVLIVIDESEDCFDKDHFTVWGRFQSTLTQTQENALLFNTSISVGETL